LSDGDIAGIVIGSIVGFLLLVVLVAGAMAVVVHLARKSTRIKMTRQDETL